MQLVINTFGATIRKEGDRFVITAGSKKLAVSAHAVKRNIGHFPEDFMFQLNPDQAGRLLFQTGIAKKSPRGGRRFLPYAFTEQGAAMLSSVLCSERAVLVNVAISRRRLHSSGPSLHLTHAYLVKFTR
jgi:hypothetical protein